LHHERKVITPVTDVPGFENAGYGRIVRFKKPQALGNLLVRIKEGLRLRDNYLSVAIPQDKPVGARSEILISSIGICAGSGGSLLNGLDVDVLFTGELSHHEALAAIEQGKVVVTAFHSNTERAFLEHSMRNDLCDTITQMNRGDALGPSHESLTNQGQPLLKISDIGVSEADRDPFEIVEVGSSW
jgi:putative NIF3 family GTP cyclohydrolase 1 type 2